MKAAEIPRLRLAAHGLTGTRATDPVDVVRALGAIQAQDYGQSMWAVGSRLRGGTLGGVERQIGAGTLVRSWPMRGTIHLMAAPDVRWMVGLGAPRTVAADTRRLQELELTEADVARAAELTAAAFTDAAFTSGPDTSGPDGGPLTRARLMAVFEQAGLHTTGQRGYHLLWRLAQARLICLGPLRGREQTFAWLDSWVPPTADVPDRDESLARLANRFASSRGPVTAHDLARWSGLTVTDARRGLAAGRDLPGGRELATVDVGGTEFWLAADLPATPAATTARGWRRPLLLAGFDEYLIGYKGRDDVLDPAHFERIVPGGNGVYKPMLVKAGRIVGTWRRELTAKRLRVEVRPFEPGTVTVAELDTAIRAYRHFLDLSPAVHAETPTLIT